MNLLTITDKTIEETSHMSSEQFGTWVRMQAKQKQESNPESLYQKFMSAYDQFMILKLGVGAKINGMEGAALKKIIEYISKESKDKSEEGILKSWTFILNSWGKLDSFTKSKMRLTDINSNLINILAQLRNGNGRHSTIQSTEESVRAIAEWDGK